MWIRTQDHKKLIDALELQIIPCSQRDFKGYCIVATSHNSLFMNKIELGKYQTIEEAYIVLSDIQYHININSQNVYQMK